MSSLRARVTSPRVALALASLLLFACPGPPPTGTFTLELGSGEDAGTFQALAEGDTVPVQSGPQGGNHLWVSLRSRDVSRGMADVHVELTDADSGERLTLPLVTRVSFMNEGPDGALEVTGLTLVLDAPAKVIGKRVRMDARVVDAANHEGVDARVVVPRWPDAP